MEPKPVILIILDGWGIGPVYPGNAVAAARTPVLDGLFEKYPHTRLECSGEAVGLPKGQMGNSEVGHLNLGAGRIVYQDITRINRAIAEGDFFDNQAFRKLIGRCRRKGAALHLIGLVSDGGVHSHLDHLLALVQLAKKEGLEAVYIQALMDGRDTPPRAGLGFIQHLEQKLADLHWGKIASVTGRFYAMDRDNRWERVGQAYRALTLGEGHPVVGAVQAVEEAYAADEADEFIKPRVVTDTAGRPVRLIQDGDGIIFFNFRADRAREITKAFIYEDFQGFSRPVFPRLGGYVTMTEYDARFHGLVEVAFPPQSLKNNLGEIVSARGWRQLRIAETEKYAHVTYFFNSGVEEPLPLEDRCLIPSTKEVPTYDLKPAMSAREVTGEMLKHLQSGQYCLIVLNYANLDMVGHTGKLEAAVQAAEVVDECLGRVLAAGLEAGARFLVTADHGNAEEMIDRANGGPHTAHTSTNPVPLILIDHERSGLHLREGILADVAPTILEMLGVPIPEEMTGHCLFEKE
ncbi:MAG: 2,3-bisphosphoglycerate-independent phosphoglycerate mutase [Deltaproteobacteria bacterium]|nr:2,3-bisphosphoglycerate-independent phosphoglycerate mutase [Deltaproteobacteria bacterium]